MKKTTEKDFELFKTECHKWIEFFGLKNWDIVYQHGNITTENRTAEVEYDSQGHRAWLRLAKEVVDSDYGVDEIKMSAFHEIGHTLLARLWSCAQARYSTFNELETAEHEIIATLQNTVFKDHLEPHNIAHKEAEFRSDIKKKIKAECKEAAAKILHHQWKLRCGWILSKVKMNKNGTATISKVDLDSMKTEDVLSWEKLSEDGRQSFIGTGCDLTDIICGSVDEVTAKFYK